MDAKLWHCQWNWCTRVFTQGSDLLRHLRQEHFTNILRVEQSEWDVYLRANEGKSGLTDSFMRATQLTAPPDVADSLDTASQHIDSQPLQLGAQSQALGTSPQQGATTSPGQRPPEQIPRMRTPTSPPSQPGPSRSPSLPLVGPSTPRKRSRSFADCAADSSPITTPVPSPLPASPPLSSLVVDAINTAATKNASSLLRQRRTIARLSRSPAPTPLPLPRRRGKLAGPSSTQGPASSQSHRSSTSIDSSTSVQDVEIQLTQGVANLTPSPAAATSQSPSHPVRNPTDSFPPLRTQAVYDSQGGNESTGSDARRFSSGSMVLYPDSRDALARTQIMSQTNVADSAASQSTQTAIHAAIRFSSGSFVLHPDSDGPEPMNIDQSQASSVRPVSQPLVGPVDNTWTASSHFNPYTPPLQLQTQAPYPSQSPL